MIELAAEIVAAYVAHNNLPAQDLPRLIDAVFTALRGLGTEAPQEAAAGPLLTPAQIRKSITANAIVSFEDGKPYKMLRRHLAVLGLTPEAYRAKWGLPVDYPMVAASYSAKRAALAKSIGLGKGRPKGSRAKRGPKKNAA